MAAGIRFAWIGRLKEPFFDAAAVHYLGKIERFLPVEQLLVRDAPGKLPPERKKEQETAALLQRLDPKDFVVALDERGKSMGSRKLADALQGWLEMPGRTPCFVIGGPFGFTGELRARADTTLRLSAMTLPHELARVLLLEQIYRALCIQRGIQYHHD